MKKRIGYSLILAVLLWLFSGAPGMAQSETETLQLRLSKIFGYSSLGRGEVEGTMRLEARGPENLERVKFIIDGNVMAEVTEPPFSLRFSTSSYDLGVHTLQATGYTHSGQELTSNQITVEFVSPDRGWQAALGILVPILVLVAAAGLLSIGVPLLFNRGKKIEVPLGEERQYGFAGGTICPRCQRPFPLRGLAINLSPVHKLDRCPHCGRWGVVRRRSIADLRATEAAERKLARSINTTNESEEEKLRKELEDSRYQEL